MHPPHRTAALLAAVTWVALSACGTRLDRQEVVRANAVVVDGEGRSSTGQPTGVATPGVTSGPGATTVGGGTATGATVVGGAPAPDAGGPGATVPGTAAPEDGGGAAVGTPGETGPIVIGSVGNYSGPAGAAAAGLPKGLQVWASAVNGSGGLFGREVQIVVVDDGGDPSRHVAALRDLVENRGAVAFSNYAPLTAPAGRQYLEERGIPAIGNSCSIPVEHESTVFYSACERVQNTYINVARAGVRFGGSNRLAILFCGEAAICRDADTVLTAQGGAQEAGADVVYRAQVSLTQPDFTSECINARDRGATSIFPLMDPNGIARMAASCARQGYRPLWLAAQNVSADLRENTGLENVLVATPIFPFAGYQNAAAQAFYDAYDTYAGGTPDPSSALGWISGKMFELAATRAAEATQSVNPASLIQALATFQGETFGGLTVPLSFPNGGASDHPTCYWAVQAGEGGWSVLEGGQLICP